MQLMRMSHLDADGITRLETRRTIPAPGPSLKLLHFRGAPTYGKDPGQEAA